MQKQILQIENTNAAEFKNDLIESVEKCLIAFAKGLQDPDGETLLTRKETAKILSISLVTLWNWSKNGILKPYRIGNNVRYKKSEVISALKEMNQSRG